MQKLKMHTSSGQIRDNKLAIPTIFKSNHSFLKKPRLNSIPESCKSSDSNSKTLILFPIHNKSQLNSGYS